MSLLSELKPKRGSIKSGRRLGRGLGCARGGTSGKGHKGQKARSGVKIGRGFEGGQMPLSRRLPKFGFNNKAFRKSYEIINLRDLEKHFKNQEEVTPESLKSKGLISKGPVKILAQGELKKSLTLKSHKISASARKAVEAAGGKVEVISS